MESNWKKRYSFRLTEKDLDLYYFLEQLPNNKRSETIRRLLNMAYRHFQEEKEQNRFQKDILNEITTIKELQQNLLVMLEKGIININKDKASADVITDDAIESTAHSFLSSFGVELD